MANTKKHGFTLIELIVVIAIIGVLAAVLVPAMMGYVKKSRRTSDIASAKRIYDSVMTTISSDDDAAESLTAQCAQSKDVTVQYNGEEEDYTLCVACSRDGTKKSGKSSSKWGGGTSDAQLFENEINAIAGKSVIPVEYTKSESGKTLNRWFICYHDDDPSQIEIWVGDSKTDTPTYRIHPQRDDNYA